MASVSELKEEDFKNHNLPADCSRFDILLAVVDRASSLYDDEAKKKDHQDSNSKCNSRKVCSTEKNLSFGSRKDDTFCFPIAAGGGHINPLDRKVLLPIKKRPLIPIAEIDEENNQEVVIIKKRKKQGNNNLINYFNPIEILLHHELPVEFKESLRALNEGMTIEKEILVIQKALTATDISPHQNRFSIPSNHIMNNFLNDDENKILESREENGKNVKKLDVNMIDPMRRKREVNFRRWVMNKDSKKKVSLNNTNNNNSSAKRKGGGASVSYVINGPWAQIVDSNKLKEGDTMQLWGVRVQGSLWFVLVKLPRN